ncbi:MAG: DUF2807 domain-containing protein [Spirochaetes bacterium]|nr:DUF2807 domain-containing protein [Spirochaetota bacterium]
MRALLFFTALFLFATLAVPCYATEYFERLPRFSRIEISGRFTVQIEPPGSHVVTNAENSMRINIRRGSISELEHFLNGDTLVLRRSGSGLQARNNIVVTLSVSNTISQLDVSAGALVRTQRNIFDDRAEVTAESGSSLELFVNTRSLFINCGRESSVVIRGVLDQIEIRATNGGTVDAEFLNVTIANVSAHTGSTVRINALEFLEATAGMRSTIYYRRTNAIKRLSEFSDGNYIGF